MVHVFVNFAVFYYALLRSGFPTTLIQVYSEILFSDSDELIGRPRFAKIETKLNRKRENVLTPNDNI